MLLTKHCKPQDRARMLKGHFKIGSHKEYSNAEESGLLSDTSEGVGATIVTGSMNFSGFIGSNYFNLSTEIPENGTSIHINEEINSSIFCTSVGDYSYIRHKKILEGDYQEGYPANHDVTAFIVLDAYLLKIALEELTNYIFKTETHWDLGLVQYSEREQKIESSKFKGITDEEIAHRTYEQAFTKPKKFRVEEEARFVMRPIRGINPPSKILTVEYNDIIISNFVSSIKEKGSDKLCP